MKKVSNDIDLNSIKRILFLTMERVSNHRVSNHTISYGRAGLLLLYSYYLKYDENDKIKESCHDVLNSIFIDILSIENLNGCEYYSGLTGVLTVLLNLRKNNLIQFEDDDLEQMEEMILIWGLEESKKGNFDFFSGAGGTMHYFVEKYLFEKENSKRWEVSNERINKFIKNLTLHFSNINNVYFFLNSNYNIGENKHKGDVSYGLVHGMTNVMISLQKYNIISKNNECSSILEKFADGIHVLKQMGEIEKPYYYINEYNTIKNTRSNQQRLGWCNSDLNILHFLKLYKIDHQDYNLNFEEAAEMIRSRDKIFEYNLLEDPYLCHGFSGVAQYYLYLYKLTNYEPFLESWSQNINKIIDFYNEKLKNQTDNTKKDNIHSLFYGDVGVALTLLTVLDYKSQTWSEVILI